MARWGSTLILAAVISAALSFTNYELRLLLWIDLWGTGIGWLIRLGLLALGTGLLAADRARHHAPAERVATDTPLIR